MPTIPSPFKRRIEELERRIKELEAQPREIHYHFAPQPMTVYPYVPPSWPYWGTTYTAPPATSAYLTTSTSPYATAITISGNDGSVNVPSCWPADFDPCAAKTTLTVTPPTS